MIHNAEQFTAWIERNSLVRGSKKSLYEDIARITRTPYCTVRNWYQKKITPNQAALFLIKKAIASGELPK